tara:strand:- start:2 stop:463 length:462 start_codon:yes stop_codon:yes gene_type:complete
MDLREKIEDQFKKALKSKNLNAINALRLIRSAIKDKDIENRTIEKKLPITDQQILSILQNLIKQRKDSIDSFKAASRDDLVKNEESEIEIIKLFLPKQLGESETKIIIQKFISDNNLCSIKEMKKVMEFLKKDYAGVIDMGYAGKISKELLGS